MACKKNKPKKGAICLIHAVYFLAGHDLNTKQQI